MTTDESNIGIWLWFALLVGTNVAWISMDLWLHYNGHELLTSEFKEGLKAPVWGPFLAFMVAGTVAAFIWHMLASRSA
jgi:hypothetical protein